MFKYLALTFVALFAVAAAKPSIITPFSPYSTSLWASPYAPVYTSPYAAYATSPYYSPHAAYSPYYSAYSSYPAYGSLLYGK